MNIRCFLSYADCKFTHAHMHTRATPHHGIKAGKGVMGKSDVRVNMNGAHYTLVQKCHTET